MSKQTEKTGITQKTILQLIETQQYRCALTGRELTPETASIDHKVPLAGGGEHHISNIWVLDHVVNRAKGTMTVDEFIAMCRDVVSHADRVDQNSITVRSSPLA